MRTASLGVSVKSLGYLIIASGVFLSPLNKELALKVICSGVTLVIFGWFLILRALKLASFKVEREKLPKRRYKMSAHISGGFLCLREGDTVKIEGSVKERIGNSFSPAKGKVVLILNGLRLESDLKEGRFSFEIPNLRRGTYNVFVRYVEGCVERSMRFQVLSAEEWRKTVLIYFTAFLIFFAVVVSTIVLSAGGGI